MAFTFTVENGSGDPAANAYVSVAYANDHHAGRSNTRWEDYSDTLKKAGIVRATDYIDKRFGRRFRGWRKTKEQALEWPRLSDFDDDGYLFSGIDELPRQLLKATSEYALRALIYGVLAPDPLRMNPDQSLETGAGTRGTTQAVGEVIRTRDVVGPIEEERWYQATSTNTALLARGVQSSLLSETSIPEYPEADLWLEELLIHSMIVGTLARA